MDFEIFCPLPNNGRLEYFVINHLSVNFRVFRWSMVSFAKQIL